MLLWSRSKPSKKNIKNLEKEMEYMSEQERKEAAEERQSFLEMADVQCPARARLFYVIKFPTLKTHVHEKRKAMAQLFDKIMKTNPLQLHVKHTYVMELPHETSHSDHPCPDFSITSNNRIGDRAMHDAVQWYMQGREEGISHVVINTDDTSDFMSDAKEEFSTSTPNSVDEIAQKIMNHNKKTFSSRKIHPVNNEDHEDELRSLVSKTEKIKETMQPSSSGIQTVKHHCQTQSSTNSSDPDEFFLLSLVPQFKMLSPRKASEVRIEFLKVLHKAQFESK
uniref:uncharacterized protein LOC120345779 n=1 Tax=Styela clava TaxID=7725 RepID=UPI001939AA07|nr:uncharacterized protein LOC120345779 [Styela clava]